MIPHLPIDYYREDPVSLWVGQFSRIEEVDAYFTEVCPSKERVHQ
jgi:hypothetical protein